jgi:sugar phosphate isomerase/epimerase
MPSAGNNVIAASPNCFFGFSTFVAYRELARAGIRHVEVPAPPRGPDGFAPEAMDRGDVEALKAQLAELGLAAISVGAYCDLLEPRAVEKLLRRIDLAERLGAPNVISDATSRPDPTSDDWRRVVNSLRFAGDYAQDHGVMVALEVHGGLTRSGKHCRELLDAVDHPAVGVNYDTGNVYYYNEDVDPADDVKLIADKVVQVHLKDTLGGFHDWDFCALGEGQVNFPAVISTLRAAGFAGAYSLELEGRQSEDLNRAGNMAVVQQSLAYLERIGLWKTVP